MAGEKKRGRPRKPDHELRHPRRKRRPPPPAAVLPAVRPKDPKQPGPPRLVPAPPAPTPAPPRNGAQGPVSPQGPGSVGNVRSDPRAADAIITAPEAEREGFRLLVLGDSGEGKSVGLRELLAEPWPAGLTLIHDDTKRLRQYPSAVAETLDSAPDDAKVVTLYRDPRKGPLIEVDEVAAVAMELGLADIPCRLVIDELDRACTPGGRELVAPALRDCLGRGRAMGISVLMTTQLPQRCPPEAVNLATAVVLYRTGQRGVNYLDERLCFDTDLLAMVPRLQKFEFVLHVPGRPWDGRVYFRPPTVERPRLEDAAGPAISDGGAA